MNELSKNQLHYLNMHRRHKRIIVVSRVSILLTFLFLPRFFKKEPYFSDHFWYAPRQEDNKK